MYSYIFVYVRVCVCLSVCVYLILVTVCILRFIDLPYFYSMYVHTSYTPNLIKTLNPKTQKP